MAGKLKGFYYGVIALAIIATVIFVLVYAVISDPAVIGSFVTAAIAAGAVVWDRRRQGELDFLREHRDRMRPVYTDMFKNVSTPDPDVEALKRFQREFILQGPTPVVRAWLRFKRGAPEDANAEPDKTWLLEWGEVLLAIREDLGYKNESLSGADLLSMYVTDADSFFADAQSGGLASGRSASSGPKEGAKPE